MPALIYRKACLNMKCNVSWPFEALDSINCCNAENEDRCYWFRNLFLLGTFDNLL